MAVRRIGGQLIVGRRDEQGRLPFRDRRWVETHRREQATARAAVLIGEWLDGHGDRRTIERAYDEPQEALS